MRCEDLRRIYQDPLCILNIGSHKTRCCHTVNTSKQASSVAHDAADMYLHMDTILQRSWKGLTQLTAETLVWVG